MQIFIFLTCMCCGIASGVLYDILYIVRSFVCGVNFFAYTVKDKIFTAVCDLLYFAALAGAYVFLAVLFGFGAVRLYMLCAVAVGVLLYLKSFHIIVAFFVRKVYNRITIKKEKES